MNVPMDFRSIFKSGCHDKFRFKNNYYPLFKLAE